MTAAMVSWWLLLVPALPLILVLAIMLWPERSRPQVLCVLAPLPGLAVAVLAPDGAIAGMPWLLRGGEVALDDLGRVFLFFSAVLWLAAATVARCWIATRVQRFQIHFLLAMGGSLGITIAGDMLSFYLFFTLMSFASYGLVVHQRSQTARHAGNVYLTFVLAGDMMIFAALVLLAHQSAGALGFEAVRSAWSTPWGAGLALTLLVLGFGVKVGLLGLHVTLPLIYRAAPTPAGMVLAGVMVNAGLLGWLRLLPTEAVAMPAWGGALVAAGVVAAFYGALAGLLQRHPAVVLAYSSISQMGIMTVGVGVAVAVSDAQGFVRASVALYALHHAFAKTALFLGVGVAARSGGRHPVLVGAGLVLPALALTGAPLTTGMKTKVWLKNGLSRAPESWGPAVEALLPWMAFATTLVLARFVWVAWARRGRSPLDAAPAATWVALITLSLCGAWIMERDVPLELWKLTVLWESLWPVLLALLLAAVAAGGLRTWRLPPLPVGDVVVWMIRGAALVVRAWQGLAGRVLPAVRDRVGRAADSVVALDVWRRAPDAAERRLVSWPAAMILMSSMILLLWALALWA